MTYPTHLNPWYVVYFEGEKGVTYYQSPYSDDKDDVFSPMKTGAMLFSSLTSAIQVAEATSSDIRVLYNREGWEEFR